MFKAIKKKIYFLLTVIPGHTNILHVLFSIENLQFVFFHVLISHGSNLGALCIAYFDRK